ncbi:RluA family pseudouridine synthase [Melaminivora jejuensis]|uniref:RluA family pseudouridine synthase n=1 Tax=Melaminivora jejuensis TaxID=1267217 RepID=UPI001E3F4382|nr:RluA family pseudouridine synthase [Melaminivora jejuensis]UHJ66190.1 RluA family pseudouridine synthase [Melaminivora jejuensis]
MAGKRMLPALAADGAAPADLVCLYADDHVLALDKPAGLLCVPGRGADKQDCLSARAQQRWPDALIVHRLDQATSGLVLMARSPAVQRTLGQAFAAQQIAKRYLAVVQGCPAPPEDYAGEGGWAEIDAPLMPDWPQRPRQKVDHAQGKASRTRWRMLASDGSAALLELQPLTGRTHQLRVHLAHIGHPILGDALYAGAAAQARAPRLLLHASALELAHPVHGGVLRLASPCPFLSSPLPSLSPPSPPPWQPARAPAAAATIAP